MTLPKLTGRGVIADRAIIGKLPFLKSHLLKLWTFFNVY
jgi:hypothetical protein